MEAFVLGSLTLSCITIQDSYNEPPCFPARASITVFTCLVDTLEASTLNEEECVLSKTVEESSSDEEKGEEVTSNVDVKGKGKQVMP
ncbi:uncharacterized protein G2W53_008142 [Senna tora]|uniref:Uncharacterized protein n=1 Tax=Senna tora TaxID=362788 RepID=A0A834X7Y8_9FABA|nr:uncharacterized protein G2W53_008142 [Senna tora]